MSNVSNADYIASIEQSASAIGAKLDRNDRGLPERSYRLHTDKKRIPVRKEHRGYAYLHPRASVPGH